MTGKLKWLIFRKVLAIVLLVTAVIGVSIISQTLAVYDAGVEAGAAMDVMAGNSSTVGGMAAIRASAGLLSIIRIFLYVAIVLLAVYFAIDTVKDLLKNRELLKKYFSQEGKA